LCVSLGNDLLFDTYAYTITPEGTTALAELASTESVDEQLKTLSAVWQLNISAAGSLTPVSSLARNIPKAELSECLAIDPHVEIVV
jgi:hypothetical protein